MRVLMVAANLTTIPYPVYPLGAGIVADVARGAGHEVRLVDILAAGNFRGDYDPGLVRQAVQDFQPDCVALSLRNLEGAEGDENLATARRLTADIRAVTSAPVVIGGAGFSLMPERALEYIGADYGLAGEGEEIWPAFLEALAAGRAAPGLCRAVPGAPQASAYDPDLVRAYAAQGGLIGVQSKRGCPLRCLYCSYPLLEGRRVRPRPVGEVLADLRFLAALPEPPQIAFADAVFNDPSGHWRELLTALVAANISLRWTAFFQPAEFDADDWRLLKASGLSGLEFGTDGACDAALKGLGKNFDFALVENLQRQCVQHGLPAAHYIIFGGPGETPATVEEGLANLGRLTGGVAFISAGLCVYPATPLAELAHHEGFITAKSDPTALPLYFSPEIDPAWLHRRLSEAARGRRDWLYPPSAAAERTEALRRLGYRGLLWDTLIGAGPRKRRRSHA